jgi:hypothetical protein
MPSSRGDARAAKRACTGGAETALLRGQRISRGVRVCVQGAEVPLRSTEPKTGPTKAKELCLHKLIADRERRNSSLKRKRWP